MSLNNEEAHGDARWAEIRAMAVTALARPRVMRLVIAAAVACAATSPLLRIDVSKRLSAASAELESERQALAHVDSQPDPAITNFAERLPKSTHGAERFMDHVQTSAKGLQVQLSSVAAEPRAPSPQALGRTALSLTLRGSYANLRRLLAETLDRQDAVVQHLSMSHAATPGEQELQLTVALLSAPLPTDEAPK